MSAATRNIPLEQYLHSPEYRHSEYVSGEVVALNLGTKRHSRIQARCSSKVDQYLDVNKIGSVFTEVHCCLTIGGEVRFRLPDVAVVLGPFVDDRYVNGAPDLCVEIRSPEDSIRTQIAKFDDYFANGCKLGWLIIPEQQEVLVLRPGESAITLGMSSTLEGGSLLPGLKVAVSDLLG